MDDQNARTIHCGNLNADKITEELLYELFLQAGPLERVSIPKDNGKNRQYGFVTYKYQCSVPYAMNVFSGTKLFNRELRLNNRCANRNNNNENNQTHGNQVVPPPLLPNMPTTHQFQMQNPYGNDALRGGGYNNRGSAKNQTNNMMPSAFNPHLPLQFPQNTQIDFQTLLAQSAQMLANSMAPIGMANDNESHKHQSKIMHRHDSRPHNQNNNYNRDKDRRNDRNDRRQDQGRDKSRDRSRSLERERKDWIRNKGKGSNRSDRRERNHRGNNDRRR